MNFIYRLLWSQVNHCLMAVAEIVNGGSKTVSSSKLVAAVILSFGVGFPALVLANPTGGQITSGSGSISQTGNTTTITQNSTALSANWKTFNITPAETVNFVQPNTSSVATNMIWDSSASQILGHLNANGQIYLINPNGIVFGQGAQVNVGGLVASTLDLVDGNNGRIDFAGAGTGNVVNQGSIHAAQGGYVVLLGNHVSNQGMITAQLGSIALGAGNAVTLTFAGSQLVRMRVDQSVLNSITQNGGLLQADGGYVIMNAGAKNSLLASVVNNTGVIEARTINNQSGQITLLGGMGAGQVDVGGTLNASALNGGRGGFIETSAHNVYVASDAQITTATSKGLSGTWLIDPVDFTIAATGGDITGASLSTDLVSNSMTIQTTSGVNTATNLYANGSTGTGNINVDDTVNWSSNTLTLSAYNNININSVMTGTGTAGLVLKYGQGTANGVNGANTATYNVNAAVNLATTGSFSTQLGSTGPIISYTIVDALGSAPAISSLLLDSYVLGANIDASATSSWNSGAGFTPIGNSATPFGGVFDGLGHTISNLTINNSTLNYAGLFGYTSSSSTIRNVGMVGGTVVGHNSVGDLVGVNFGTISNAYATGSVSGNDGIGDLVGVNLGTISNAYATGSVNGNGNVGGLAGLNTGLINNSYANSSVTGGQTGGTNAGGLVGYNSGTITNAFAWGGVSGNQYVGGLVGLNYGAISNVYAIGSVSGNSDTGGLVGGNQGSGTITNAYWDSSINTTGVGVGAVGSATGLSDAQMQQQSSFSGFDFTTPVWGVNNSYPVLCVFGGCVTTVYVDPVSGSSIYGTAPFFTYDLVSAGGSVLTPSNVSLTGTAVDSSSAPTLSSNAGNYSFNYLSGLSLIGTGASSYVLQPYTTPTSWTVNPLALVGASIGSAGSIYGSVLQPGVLAFTNVVGHDVVTAAVSVNYTSSNLSTAGKLDTGSYTQSASSTLTGANAGNYTFSGYTTPTDNYVVNPLALTGTIAAGSSVYGSTLNPGVVSFSNEVAGDALSATVSVNTTGNTSGSGHLKAGSYTGIESVTGLSGADAGNYTVSGITGNYTVSKLALSGTSIAGVTTIYGTPAGSGLVSFANVVGTDVVTDTVVINNPVFSTSHNLDVGSHTQTAGSTLAGADAGNYTFSGYTTPTGNYVVNPLALTGTIAAGSSVYGSTLSPGVVSFSNEVAGDALSAMVSVNTLGNTSGSGHLKAGSYTGIESVTGLSGADAGNYTFSGITGNYTVSKLALSGTSIAGVTTTYGSSAGSGLVSFANVVGGDAVTDTAVINNPITSTSNHLDAGSYTQTAGSTLGGADAGNYTFGGYVTPTSNYVVNPLALTGTIAAGSSVYGSTLNPGVVSFSNEVAGDALSATVSVNTSGNTSGSGHLKAGSYTGIESVTGLSGADAGNYSFVGLSGNYVVSLAPLIYVATPVTITQGQQIPVLTGSVNGFVAGDNLVNSTAGTLTWSSNAVTTSPAGRYYIDGSGLNSVNYNFSQAAGNAQAVTLVSPIPLVEVSSVATLMEGNISSLLNEIPLSIIPSSMRMEMGVLGLSSTDFYSSWMTYDKTILTRGLGKNVGFGLRVLNGGLKLPSNVVGQN